MKKTMLIDAGNSEEIRVCLLQNGKVEDFDFESATRKPLRGNIYLARVTRVEPSLQAAFVEFGGNRHGFLAFNEIHPDYYQIPVSDRRQIKEAEAEEAELASLLNIAHGDDDDGLEDIDAPKSDEESEVLSAEDDSVDFTESEHDVDSDLEIVADIEKHPDETSLESDVSNDLQHGEADRLETIDQDAAETVDDHDDASSQEEKLEDAEDAESGFESTDEDLSSLSRDELIERYKDARRKRARLLRNYKIQEVIKRRQIILVQAVKEERGNKGAALTTYLSLAGRYCVLMPNTARGGGISRKIPVAADRKRLRRVVAELEVPEGMGLIIRTAGAKRTKAEIKRDYDYLTRLWENIRTLTLKSIAPCLIYEEASLIKRAIRDLYDKDISQVLVEGDNGYREAKDFMKMLMPSHSKNVQPYKESTPLFLKYGVEPQLDAMYQPVVRLRSGGYIVINQTEALIAIDVNSGKATRERNIEQTALRTNLEAADEAARQCRLRDLAGLIVIDFIDMEESRNNRTVEKRLKDALRTDRARIQVGRISTFGLLEMSRQRRRSGIVDGTTHACPTCGGAGAVRSHEMAALRILRTVEHEALSGRAGLLQIKSAIDVTLYILNHKREWLNRIETQYGVSVEVLADPTKAGDNFDIDRIGSKKDVGAEGSEIVRADTTETIEPEYETADELDHNSDEQSTESSGRRRRKRRKRRKDASPQSSEDVKDASDQPQPDIYDGDVDTSETKDASASSDDDQKPKKRRRRGRRSGRKNSNRQSDSNGQNDETQIEVSIESVNEANAGYGSELNFVDSNEPSAPPPEEKETTVSATDFDGSGQTAPNGGTPSAMTFSPTADAPSQSPASDADAKPSSAVKKSSRKGWWQKAFGE
ncbi:MAG: Rne/Rng family ribonuclease [Parvularculaceae bacterium]